MKRAGRFNFGFVEYITKTEIHKILKDEGSTRTRQKFEDDLIDGLRFEHDDQGRIKVK